MASAASVIAFTVISKRAGVLPAFLFSQGQNQVVRRYRRGMVTPTFAHTTRSVQLDGSGVRASAHKSLAGLANGSAAGCRASARLEYPTHSYRRGSPPKPCLLPQPVLPPATAAVGGSGCALPTGRCSPRLFQSRVSSAATKSAPAHSSGFSGRRAST